MIDTQNLAIFSSAMGARWLASVHQLAQIRRTGKMPLVVFTAGKKTKSILVNGDWIGGAGENVVRSRNIGQHQRHLSIRRRRYARLLDTEVDAVALRLGIRSVWFLSMPRQIVQHARPRVAAPRRFNG